MNKYRIREIGSLKNGLNYSSEHRGKGCKLIGIPDFKNRYLADYHNLAEVEDSIVSDSYLLQDNDILLVRSNGNRNLVGRCMLLQNVEERLTYSGFCIRFRPNTGVLNPLYMLYLLKSPTFRNLFSTTQQTSIANLNQDTLGEIVVDIPSLPVQETIVAVIHPITEAIELNNQINDNLQAMVYDLYMHLFFDKQPNGTLGDIIVEHPKSQIFVNEAKDAEGDYPFFTSGDAILYWSQPLVDDSVVLLNTGGNADVKYYSGTMAYSTDTWCVGAKDNLTEYMYMLLYSIKPELNQKFFWGTGLKHLQKPLLKDRPIYVPSTEELTNYNDIAKHALSMKSDNFRENLELQALRDWLLPMLMNGQATVKRQETNYRLSDC